MRAAAIFGPGDYSRHLRRFHRAGAVITRAYEVPDYADAVLIFGGDGTVHRHLRAMVERKVPALVVPAGSGNDFARALGLRNVSASLRAWHRFVERGTNTRSVDVGVIAAERTDELFCCIAGCGLDAEANRRANRMPRWLRKRGGYVVAAVAELARWQPLRIRVEADDRSLDQPATLVAFANAPEYGDGMRMAPGAQLDDGLLDVCFVRATPKPRILRFFPTVFTGRHVAMAEVEYFRTSRLRVEAERSLDIYADGEYIGRTPAEVTVRPRALRVIVPAQPQAS